MAKNKYKYEFIAFDTKTTGLHAWRGDEVLQLAIVDQDGKTLFNKYFKPERQKYWPEAEKINHISYEMVKDCKSLKEYTEEIKDIFNSSRRIVGYNLEFDWEFLDRVIDLSDIHRSKTDMMKLYSKWDREFFPDSAKIKWKSLKQCAKYFDYDWEKVGIPMHNALADALATRYCYKALQEDEGYQAYLADRREEKKLERAKAKENNQPAYDKTSLNYIETDSYTDERLKQQYEKEKEAKERENKNNDEYTNIEKADDIKLRPKKPRLINVISVLVEIFISFWILCFTIVVFEGIKEEEFLATIIAIIIDATLICIFFKIKNYLSKKWVK